MTKLKSLIAGLVLATLSAAPSLAQGVGQLGAGQVWGNPTASQDVAQPTNLAPLFARGFCTTANASLAYISGAWGCITYSAELSFTGSVLGVTTGGITSAMLRNSGALSVIGRSANSAGVPADISAPAASDCVFRESASTVGCGTIATNGIGANAVSYAKVQQVAASRVLGNPTGIAANVSEISLGATLAFSGTALQTGAMSGDVTSAANSFATTIAANAVTYAKMQQATASRLLGNPTGSLANVSEISLGATLAFSGSALQTGAISGDATSPANSFAITIAANAITNAKMATMAANTVKANATGGIATPTDVTAATARSSSLLNVDSYTGHGDSIYTILATDRTVGTNAAFTASRTWTLPAANAVNPGQEIIVADFQGTVTGVNTLVISRAGADTINGVTSVTIAVANGAYLFKSDGTSKWTAQALGAAAGGGVSSLTCGAGLSGGTITTSGTCAVNATIPPQGRLTLTSGTPVLATSVAAATTLYYTLYAGNIVPIYDGTNMVPTAFTELSAVLGSNWTSATNYDWYVGSDSGTIRLCSGAAWTNATTRAETHTRVNGILLNTASITCRYNNTTTFTCAASRCTYVGTTRTTAAGQIDFIFGAAGVAAVLNVWNAHNKVDVKTTAFDNTASWTYANGAGTIRAANAAGSNVTKITFLSGYPEDGVAGTYGTLVQTSTTSGAFGKIGLALDSTSSFDKQSLTQATSAVTTYGTPSIRNNYLPQTGSHFLSGNEAVDTTNTITFYGQANQFLCLEFRM